jgi:hypothetical protein
MNVKLAGLDLRIAGYAADIQACWEVVPVLRYVAREPIRGELARRTRTAIDGIAATRT